MAETTEARVERHKKEREQLDKDWKEKADGVRKKVEECAAAHLKHMNDEREARQKLQDKQAEENKKAAEAEPVAV